MPVRPPEGIVALLFTDVQDSTRLARDLGRAWPGVLAAQHELLAAAIAAEGGHLDSTHGDAVFAVFRSGEAGARAAVAAQRALRAHPWPAEAGEVRVRMGLHVGRVDYAATGYVGLEVHRAARVASAAHGGQLLLTRPARDAAGGAVQAEPLGSYRLKDFPAPEALFCARIDGRGAEAFPPPRALDVRPTNLPPAARDLLGRADDLRFVAEARRGGRLVTITGRGGVGKTSLALVAAREALDDCPGGVWWVSLAAVADADAPAAIAGVLHADGQPPSDAVVRRLEGHGPTLLVVDNLEHLPGLRGWLEELCDRLPELTILATSQTPLRLPAEQVVRLAPLDDEAAVALFEAETVRTRTGRPLQAAEREDAVAVCRSLDGLPLAIELAAARLNVLTPRQLRERLLVSPDLLGVDRPGPARHRSLRATLEWTLEQLTPPARTLFARLGVFAGAVELSELEAVCGGADVDVLEALALLLDFSLVARVESGDGRIRFGLPTALRTLAASRLHEAGQADRMGLAHARRQFEIAWRAWLPKMTTVGELQAAVMAEPEALLAIERSRSVDPGLGAALATALGLRWVNTGRRANGVALIRAAQATEDIEDPLHLALVRLAAGAVSRFDGRSPLPDLDAALPLARAVSPVLEAAGLAIRSIFRSAAGDHVGAVADASAAVALASSESPAMLAGALLWEAQALSAAGDSKGAADRVARSLAAAEGHDATAAWLHDSFLGDLAYARGSFVEALEAYVRSAEQAEIRADDEQVGLDVVAAAGCLARLGADRAAAELLGIADAQCANSGVGTEMILQIANGVPDLRAALERLGPAAGAPRAAGAAVPAGRRAARARVVMAAALDQGA